ncbi:MAG: hypothetical protein K0R18_913 [Bacillales bacterium]|jgi:archaellum component FlaG (FlaF/FlaG flagellin family)|nr:hypothetical protein [Bacillales bacterium]
MKNFIKVLKSHSGETLVETIIATLLIAIAFTVLTMMITLAGNMNRSASEVSRAISSDSKALNNAEGKPFEITFTDDIPISGFDAIHIVNCDVQSTGRFTLYSGK